jgi:hypothetical protein
MEGGEFEAEGGSKEEEEEKGENSNHSVQEIKELKGR